MKTWLRGGGGGVNANTRCTSSYAKKVKAIVNQNSFCDLWQLCASQLQCAKILPCMLMVTLCPHCVVVICQCECESVWAKEEPRPLPAPDGPWRSSLFPQTEQLDPGEPLGDNMLSVRKPTVGRTHSLPNDSYMFIALSPGPAQLLAQGPQHIQGTYRSQSGNVGHVFKFEM